MDDLGVQIYIYTAKGASADKLSKFIHCPVCTMQISHLVHTTTPPRLLLDFVFSPPGALDSQEDTDWTTGTLVTATLFVLTLVASVAIFSVLCILLRRRAASHSVQVV